ncbi:MAG TPA: hypothetical protein VEV18_07370 [Steroidobacteraceae bacterium]|nr:hypothetical protein [Steroidobacteraceae bacterium]
MGQEPEQIERHIYQTRARLEQNVAELRARVRSNLDWRVQFNRHPAAMAAVAFGGGLLIAIMFGRARESARLKRRAFSGSLLQQVATGRTSMRSAGPRPSWNEIVDTLIEMGPAQVRALFGELLPALRHYIARR